MQFLGESIHRSKGARWRRSLLRHSSALIMIAASSSAFAQGQNAAVGSQGGSAATVQGLEQVVVTAQRRAEPLQDVPITISAVSSDELAQRGITNTLELGSAVPGLSMDQSQGYALPHLRGVGNSGVGPGIENSVALYVDNVYIASLPASALSLDNVQRVEVLKGPQGTLFGRNSTGGLIQVITKDPEHQFSGSAEVSVGNYGIVRSNAYVTGGLSQDVAANLAVSVSHQGQGFGKNILNGRDVYDVDHDIAVSGKILAQLDSRTRATIEGDFSDVKSSLYTTASPYAKAPNYYYPGSVPLGNIRNVAEDAQPKSKFTGGGVSVHIEHDFDGFRLKSISAYRRSRYTFNADFDFGPAPYTRGQMDQKDRQFSQEIQLQSTGSTSLDWTLGIYYLHLVAEQAPLHLSFGGPAINPAFPLTDLQVTAEQDTDSVAGYAQATYHITPSTHLTGGLRWTYERRDLRANSIGQIHGFTIPLGAPVRGHFTTTKPEWRVALDQKVGGDVLLYATYNRGFKSGGYNLGDPSVPPFKTESLDAYEVGAKTESFHHTLRLNLAGFYYKYKNIQVSRYVNGVSEIYNGAASNVYGIDLDADYEVSSNFYLSAGLEWLDDHFTNFPNADYFVNCPTVPYAPCSRSAKGNRLPQASDFSATVSATYTVPLTVGKLAFNIADAYRTKFYFEPNNSYPQKAYHLLDASIAWTNDTQGLTVSLWGKNLTNSVHITNLGSALNAVGVSYGAPLTFGGSVKVAF